MSSILDSAKLVFTDSNAFLKLGVMTLFPYYIYNVLVANESWMHIGMLQSYQFYLLILCVIIFTGYLVSILHASLQEENYILPPLNIFKYIWVGVKTLVACAIPCVASVLGAVKLIEIIPDTVFKGLLSFLIYVFAFAIAFCSIIFFSLDLHISEGINVVKIAKNFYEIPVYVVLSIFVLLLFNLITGLVLILTIYYIFGDCKLLDFTACFIFTFNLSIYFQNLSHVYFEQMKN